MNSGTLDGWMRFSFLFKAPTKKQKKSR